MSEPRFVTQQTALPGTVAVLVPVYNDALWTDSGSLYGRVELIDLTTGEALAKLRTERDDVHLVVIGKR